MRVGRATAASQGLIIIPVGSTEQHGAHLPLGTDTMVAMMLAEDAAVSADVVVAPPSGLAGVPTTWWRPVRLRFVPRC